MATLGNKKKLAAVASDSQEGPPRNSQSQKLTVPRGNEEYITQVSEEIESRVAKKLSLEVNKTKNRFLVALSNQNRSWNIPEYECRKPGTNGGSFPE